MSAPMSYEAAKAVVAARCGAIPDPPSILAQLEACGDDPVAKGFVMLQSIADYICGNDLFRPWENQ